MSNARLISTGVKSMKKIPLRRVPNRSGIPEEKVKITLPMSDGSGPTPIIPYTKDSTRTGLIGFKKGMTSIWDEWGRQTPVTVLQVENNQVLKSRFDSISNSFRVIVGGGSVHCKRLKKPVVYQFLKYRVRPRRHLREFNVSSDACLPSGLELHASHFVPGQFVDIQGTSIGKGFQGVMKRHGFKGGRATHGNSLSHRSLGSTGGCQDPGKVWPGKKMAGRMGGETVTVQSLKIMKIDTVHNLIFVKGHVPGVDDALVTIRDALRKKWIGQLFPQGTKSIPFPTFMGDPKSLPRELTPDFSHVDPKTNTTERDPFARGCLCGGDGKGNVRKRSSSSESATNHASMTLKILAHINNVTDVKLDDDIAAFKLEDLKPKEIDAATQEILIQRQIELGSSSNQCAAWNNSRNPARDVERLPRRIPISVIDT